MRYAEPTVVQLSASTEGAMGVLSDPVLETPAFFACLDDVTLMSGVTRFGALALG